MMVVMAENGEKIGSLEEEALRRKERLLKLKRKNPTKTDVAADNSKNELPKPKFRSYKPQDDNLQSTILEEAKPINVDEEVMDQLNAAKEKVILEELDITSLAPRKPDWDLKRDIAKKLERLEKRTQASIAELIWERLKQGENDNIGAMVNMLSSGEEK